MKLSDSLFLLLLAAIWGSSFIFMRASVEAFGPITLIAVRIIVAGLCMVFYLAQRKRRAEFFQQWKILALVGILGIALPFSLLAFASLTLTGGTVSILNAMTPVFTALIAHFALNNRMNMLQFVGMFISIFGLAFLVWGKVSWSVNSWFPILAGVSAACMYGVANNLSKKYLGDISVFTATSGSLLFASAFMFVLLLFFIPDTTRITPLDWLYGLILGVICTAAAIVIHFKLIKNIGPTRAATVTFLIPIFSFIWGYLLLQEKVTPRMLGATVIILFGMSLVMEILKLGKVKLPPQNIE